MVINMYACYVYWYLVAYQLYQYFLRDILSQSLSHFRVDGDGTYGIQRE